MTIKTYIKALIALLICLSVSTSCSDDWDPSAPKAQGTIDMASLVIDLPQGSGLADSDFTVTLSDDYGNPMLTVPYRELSPSLSVPEGDYIISAFNMTPKTAAWWDTPYYTGHRAVTVDRRKTVAAGTVQCRMAAVEVTVNYADSLGGATTTVTYGQDAQLTFTAPSTRHGYFMPQDGANTLMADTQKEVNGVFYGSRSFVTDVKAGQSYTIDVTALKPLI